MKPDNRFVAGIDIFFEFPMGSFIEQHNYSRTFPKNLRTFLGKDLIFKIVPFKGPDRNQKVHLVKNWVNP